MALQETLGDRLTQAMKHAGLKNRVVAEAVGVHETTVSRWRSDLQMPGEQELTKVAELLRALDLSWVTANWLRYGDALTKARAEASTVSEVPQGTIYEVAFASPHSAQRGRLWIEQFLLELTEEGADEDFIAWARRFLLQPNNYALYLGGTKEPMGDEQKLTHMKGLAAGVRAILKERLRKGKGK